MVSALSTAGSAITSVKPSRSVVVWAYSSSPPPFTRVTVTMAPGIGVASLAEDKNTCKYPVDMGRDSSSGRTAGPSSGEDSGACGVKICCGVCSLFSAGIGFPSAPGSSTSGTPGSSPSSRIRSSRWMGKLLETGRPACGRGCAGVDALLWDGWGTGAALSCSKRSRISRRLSSWKSGGLGGEMILAG